MFVSLLSVLMYDVVVVGAGPAGSMAAKTAAERGLRVLLIERNREIGVPVRCAEAVERKIEQFVRIDKRCICAEVTSASMYSPDGTRISRIGSGVGGYVLDRALFDKALAMDAARAGAEIKVNTYAYEVIKEGGYVTGVKVKDDYVDYTINADVVVAADGVESRIGQLAGLNTKLGLDDIDVCAEYLMCGLEGRINENSCDLYFGKEIAPKGYAWAFPKGNGCANVGIAIRGLESKEGARALDYLNKFVNNRFPDAGILAEIHGVVPVSGPLGETVANGIVLVGDAARLVDPFTGGGISYAVQSGIIAGNVIGDAKEAGEFSKEQLMDYQHEWERSFGKELKKQLKLRKIFDSLSDEDMNAIAHSVSQLEEINGATIIKEIVKRNPLLALRIGMGSFL